MKRAIETDDAPGAVAAYSQATTDGDLLFTAGQGPMTPDGELLADEPVAVQTRRTLENVRAILREAGCTLDDVLKATVYLADMDDYEAMNGAYAEFFGDDPPARSAVAVAELPFETDVEIEAVASMPDGASPR